MSDKKGCMPALLALAGIVLLIPLAVIWKGFVLSKLWGWFIVERFGLPALTVAQAIGLAIVVGMFTYARSPKDDEEWMPYVIAFVGPLISLFVGWIVQFWV